MVPYLINVKVIILVVYKGPSETLTCPPRTLTCMPWDPHLYAQGYSLVCPGTLTCTLGNPICMPLKLLCSVHCLVLLTNLLTVKTYKQCLATGPTGLTGPTGPTGLTGPNYCGALIICLTDRATSTELLLVQFIWTVLNCNT